MKQVTDKLWHPDFLGEYPMDSNAMVHDLSADQFNLLLTYVEEVTFSPKLSALIAEISRRHPKYLRVKELFETMEAYKRIGQAIYEQWQTGSVETIYDFACGHGLLGILLAYRFHKLNVVCMDLEYRPAFGHYLQVAQELRVSLPNVTYIEGDFNDLELGPGSYIICIHACNEATRDALKIAEAAGACFAAMPCCIRDGIYFKRINHVDDCTRYAAAVGVIAGRFNAYKLTAIDERITNRNLIILGKGARKDTDYAGIQSRVNTQPLCR
ncbi:class I SAM-dependent methyltransferase [Planctomycetota bacterium]